MSITDELRKAARNTEGANGRCGDLYRGDLEIIADTIDVEHEREVTMAHGEAVTELGNIVAREYVKLPVDADGEVWHVGDFAVGEVNPKNPKAIERMIWYGPDLGWELETDTIIYPCPDRPRHHHKPTVEDLLDKFALEIDDARHIPDADEEYARIRTEFAAKLRLADDGEEQ